jgi:FHS family L-fucose permease-like MFS transporter
MIIPSSGPALDHQTSLLPPRALRAFVLVTGLFFLWGIPNDLNDVLIRQFMKSIELSRFQAGLVQSAFYLGYFLLALPAGLLMRRRGTRAALSPGSSCSAPAAFCSGQPAQFGL